MANAKTRKPIILICSVGGAPYASVANSSTAKTSKPKYPRVRKDILTVGPLTAHGKTWDVTSKTLTDLVAQFNLFRAAGNRVPWIWNHEGGAQDRIGDVVALSEDGQTLWATCEIHNKADVAKFGQSIGDESNHEVSVEIHKPFQDGKGNEYPICLVHLANVINPVVPGQKPFVRLSKGQSPMTQKIKFAKGAAMDTTSDTFTMDEVKTLLNSAGMAVPAEVDNKDKLMGYMLAQGGAEASEPDAPASADGTTMGASMDAGMPAGSGGEIKTLSLAQNRIKAVEKQLADERKIRLSLETKVATEAKTAFVGKLDSLIAANRLTPAMKDGLLTAGESAKWQLSLLTPFDSMPNTAVHTSSKSRQFGNGVHGDGADAIKQRQDEIRQRMGIASTS